MWSLRTCFLCSDKFVYVWQPGVRNNPRVFMKWPTQKIFYLMIIKAKLLVYRNFVHFVSLFSKVINRFMIPQKNLLKNKNLLMGHCDFTKNLHVRTNCWNLQGKSWKGLNGFKFLIKKEKYTSTKSGAIRRNRLIW